MLVISIVGACCKWGDEWIKWGNHMGLLASPGVPGLSHPATGSYWQLLGVHPTEWSSIGSVPQILETFKWILHFNWALKTEKWKRERYEQDEDLYSWKPKHIISDSGWFILFMDWNLKRFQARVIWASWILRCCLLSSSQKRSWKTTPL